LKLCVRSLASYTTADKGLDVAGKRLGASLVGRCRQPVTPLLVIGEVNVPLAGLHTPAG